MQKISRRQLAQYTAERLANGNKDGLANHLAAVLLVSKRLGQVDLLIEDISYELEDRGLATTATASSATQLSEDLKQEILEFIKTSTKSNNVELHNIIDASLVGGLRIDTAKRSWDQTIKRRLTDIKEAF